MYSVQSILDLPQSNLKRLLTFTKKDVVDLLQLLFDLGLIDREFDNTDILRELLTLTNEELLQELPEFIIEDNPTRGQAIVFQYNSETWYDRRYGMPVTVNGVTFPFVDYVDNKSPLAYFVGTEQEVTLSKRDFVKFKREVNKIAEANLKLSNARKKVDIRNVPKVRSVPVFWSSSNRGSDKYIQEYGAYKDLVNEYFRFISWEKIVEAYEEEEREYCEFVFDSAVGKVSRQNEQSIKRMKKYFLELLSNSQASKLAIVVSQICDKDGSYTKVCTKRMCARDYNLSIEMNIAKPKNNLVTLLERFEERRHCEEDNISFCDDKFSKDLFNFVEYYFLKSGMYKELSSEDFPNFYREE